MKTLNLTQITTLIIDRIEWLRGFEWSRTEEESLELDTLEKLLSFLYATQE